MAMRMMHQLPNRKGRWRIRLLSYAVGVFAALLATSLIRGDERGSGQGDQPIDRPLPLDQSPLHQPTLDEIKRWIEQLASSEFRLREEAVDRLTACDATVIKPLREAASHSNDPEVKARCLAVADRIYQSNVNLRMRAFLSDSDPTQDHGFGGWIPFSEMAGQGRAAKRLFALMIQSNNDLAGGSLLSSSELATKASEEAEGMLDKFRTQQEVAVAETVSLLYRCIVAKGEVPPSVDQVIVLMIRTAPFAQEIRRPPLRSVLQPLLGKWMLVTRSDPTSVLALAIEYELSPAIEKARQILAQPRCEPSLFLVATVLLMKFGNSQDLDLLTPWIHNTEPIKKGIQVRKAVPVPLPPVDPPTEPGLEFGPSLMMRPPGELQLCELRYQDLALAASAYLAKREDLRQFFPRIQTHPIYVFFPDSLALPEGDDEARVKIAEALSQPSAPARDLLPK